MSVPGAACCRAWRARVLNAARGTWLPVPAWNKHEAWCPQAFSIPLQHKTIRSKSMLGPRPRVTGR